MMVNRSLLGVASRHRRLLFLTVGLQLLVVGSFLPQAWALAHGLAAMVDGDPDGVLRALMVILALIVVRFLLTWRQARAAARLGVAVRVDLRDQALVGALVPAALHDQRRRDGALRATLVDGVDGVDAYVTRYLPAVAEVIVMSPVAALLVTLVHPIAGAAAGLAVTASVLLPMLWKRAMSRRSLGHWDSYERLSSDLLEALRGMTTLRVLGQVGQARTRIAERSEQLHRATVRVMRTSLFSTALIDLAIQGGSLAAVALAVVQVGSGEAGATTAYLVLLLAVEVFRPVRDLSRAWHAGYLGTTAVGALEGLGVGARRAPEGRTTGPVAGDGPDRAPIELDGVSFRYPGSPAPVLDRVCATFPEGRVTAVVGSSGAGKSTLLDLVLGHLTPDHGRIHRADQPLRSDDIAVITQRPLLFEGTVRDNVRVGRPEASDREILRACAAAGILEEVTSMPAGLDSRVAAAGVSLSGGQRQRLAIARAVVANRPVLLADEPTSALDPAAARAVTRTLAQLARDRIVIVVAHREESLEGVSRVLELREGSLLARDTEEVTA